MRFLAALFLSKVFLFFLVVLVVLGAIRGRLRLQLRLTPDHPSPVPTRWAIAVHAGARLHRRLQAAAREVADLAPPKAKRLRRAPAPTDAQQAAHDTIVAAVAADKALASAARLPKGERRAALKRATQQVAHVEQLADRAVRRARMDSQHAVVTSTTHDSVEATVTDAAVVRLEP